jgi:spore coat protein U-like protein
MRHHCRPLIRTAACLVLLLLAAAGRAEAAGCTVSTTSVVCGVYNVCSSGPVDSTGTIVYRCRGNSNSLVIAITKGQSNTFLPRQMTKGSEQLSYNLYKDAARTEVWSDNGTGVYYDPDPNKNVDTVVQVYGRLPSGQDISAGSYGDTVTVVVFY